MLYVTSLYSMLHVCVHVCRRFLPLVFYVDYGVTPGSSQP